MKVVISGNRPNPSEYSKFPSFIFFDGRLDESLTNDQWKRIEMVSENFSKLTSWRGVGKMTDIDLGKLKIAIETVHLRGKKIRFWNTPDSFVTWKLLKELNVDYINTDQINKLADFLTE